MSSIRQQLADAMLLALNTGRPAGVSPIGKWTGLAIETSKLPFSSLARLKEVVHRPGNRGDTILRRNCQFVVEHLVCATGNAPTLTAEENAEVLLSWDTKALAGNQFGGLAMDTIETGITWTLEQGEVPYARVQHEFEVSFTTRVADADQRA